ncbi:transcriptional regulator [Pacificitalea manganoxidans]|uniref:Transcriptional regulator n=2 Tax=Pacificitalea manganoxidans TaxID=1411902 RepID=A0A291LZN0_9RHOB|nr:transcriptional regulator [Pacificitalea manganoxidans]
MSNADWRTRLADAIGKSGKSKRAVSLASGNGPGYVHSIIAEGKDPTITNLLAVCDAIPVSMVYILHGHEMTPEDALLLKELHRHPSKRAAIQSLLKPE